MFEKVLIATDFSAHAKKVIECIGEMPGLKEVLLLNVISRDPLARVWDPVSDMKDVEKKLEEEAKAIRTPGIAVNVKVVSVLEGEVASAINKVAMDEDVSLVAMGARGRSLIMSALLGSASRNVLRFGKTHLLIMRYKTLEDSTMEKYCARVFAKVLFPTDLSQQSEVALSFLKSLKGIGEIVLLNVVSKGETDEEIDANVALAKDKVAEISQSLKAAGIQVTSKVVVGQSTEVIKSEAEKEDVSLIAISSQGASAIKKGRIGSTAYDVANSASRPVLILRQEKMASY
ncbi:MAG TPA: universal stress protein [Methanothrix sp.]|jgi:nucleotide-binding universal stress UspA family protein|uniref:universal stress protein n=1 Tax=Methanothrix sp. TaxID=90426 RepID=UPI002B9C622F|nr:universal stress protein [Methanothrix sp.]MDI9417777.1 universal stress protein [Euryarchaeota archaeon]HON36863.1 universal stress protein [Methanothrix sp.]HRU76455.1 universal stress protein [Methanothrix sp.]